MHTYTFNFKTSQPLTEDQLTFLLEQFNNTVLFSDFPSNDPNLEDVPEEITEVELI